MMFGKTIGGPTIHIRGLADRALCGRVLSDRKIGRGGPLCQICERMNKPRIEKRREEGERMAYEYA